MLQNSNNYNPTMLKVTLTLQAKKKVVLFPEIGRVKTFLSPTRPPKSNVYENIYFLFQKYIHTNKTFSTGKFILMNLRFFSRSLFFQPRKKLLEQFFKRKLYLKNSIKLIIYIYIFFAATRVKIFVVTCISGNKNFIYLFIYFSTLAISAKGFIIDIYRVLYTPLKHNI